LGIDAGALRERRRSFARACNDWTEPPPQHAGPRGASLLERFIADGWLERNARDRALRVTPLGRTHFARRFQIEVP
jgi:hypothetical protein